jgi:hypothetical protein
VRITEFNGSNFPWSAFYIDPNTHSQHGMANVHTMMQRYVNIMRTPSLVPGFSGTLGFQGYFDFNGFTLDNSQPPVEAWDPHVSDSIPNRIILGGDPYNSISNPIATGGIGKDDPAGQWTKLQQKLDLMITYCRNNGYLSGFGEFGMIYNCSSPYSTNDQGYYFQKMHDYCAANADVIAYACLYNETTGNENDGFFYMPPLQGSDDTLLGSGPSPVGGTAATYRSGSNSASSWVDTPSKNKQLALAAYKALWKAGTMIYTPPVTPPPPVTVSASSAPSRLGRHHRGWIKG